MKRHDVKKLGRGRFGSVTLAQEDTKFVVVKTMPLRYCEAFRREKQAVDFNHANLIKVLSSETAKDDYIIRMEYVGTNTLQDVLQSTTFLSEKRITSYGRDIARGANYLHNLSYVHLDIKPGNIIVNEEKDILQLCDFGFCQNVNDIEEQNVKEIGTIAYAAPEIFRGLQLTTQADIYSIGICCWTMLTLQEPYEDKYHLGPDGLIFAIIEKNFDQIYLRWKEIVGGRI